MSIHGAGVVQYLRDDGTWQTIGELSPAGCVTLKSRDHRDLGHWFMRPIRATRADVEQKRAWAARYRRRYERRKATR